VKRDRSPAESLARRHLAVGWTVILVFVCLGLVLDAMHALKVAWYVDVDSSTRRLMWTLSHAHGVLLGVVNLAFAFTLLALPERTERHRSASTSLIAASALLPGGFFLGGLVIHGGDPGLGVLLGPIGAVLLVLAVALVLRAGFG
jgi:hypothetical protein